MRNSESEQTGTSRQNPPDQRARIISIYNSFTGKNLDALDDFYDANASFYDPATEAHGLAGIRRYYAHAYKNVEKIRFDFDPIGRDGPNYYAPWTMTLTVRGLNQGRQFSVPGLSHMRFNTHQKVEYHRDYLDLGALVYERLPLQGVVIGWIKKMLKA